MKFFFARHFHMVYLMIFVLMLCAQPLYAAQDIDPCSLLSTDEVSAVVGIKGLSAKSSKSRGSISCTYAQPYSPAVNLSVLHTRNARLGKGQTCVADMFAVDKARETRPRTDVPGMGMEAYSVERAVFVLVSRDLQLGVYVPGGKDAPKATAAAKELAQKALSRLK